MDRSNGLGECAACGAPVPLLPFCVRCGAERQTGARRFAAAPHERASVPAVVSTLFPQLPRRTMSAFRAAFVVGVAIVVGLTIAGLYPLAIGVAAVTVPALIAIYLYDADVYEDEPLVVYGLTVVWGIAMGVVVAVVGRRLIASGVDAVSQTTAEAVRIQGIALPLLTLVLALLGPLVLLPYRRFNDVLDGTTFGAVSAVWLIGTQLLIQSWDLFDTGFRPGGPVHDWLLRLTQLAVTVPLLWAGVGGAVAGTFWLRYRAGGRGRPWLAVVVGAAAVTSVSIIQLTLPLWFAVICSALAAAAALGWLRRLLHVGLLQEAGERAIGPELTCLNCGGRTPRHTFCGSCGVALRALPKGAQARLRDAAAFAVFGLALVAAGGAAAGGLALRAPEAPVRVCLPGEPCGGPPSTSPRRAGGRTWESESGVSLAYDVERWLVEDEEPGRLRLRDADGDVLLELEVGPTVDRALDERLPSWVRISQRLGLPIPHGPNLGYVDGAGAWHEGLVDAPQGPKDTVTVASLSAERGAVEVAATAVFFFPASDVMGSERVLRDAVDSVLNTVVWPSPRAVPSGLATSGLRPEDVGRAYGIDQLWRRGIRGRGETVAVISLDGFRDEDIAEYDHTVGIVGAPPVERVEVGPGELGRSSPKEVALDLEVIRAVAPQVSILNYEAPSSWAGFTAALRKVNDDGRAQIVSVSWGKCLTRVDPAVRSAMDRELARAVKANRTVFAASGDSGAYSCLHSESELDSRSHVETVDWPAASANVVAVGGTRLATRQDGAYFAEDGWEDTLANRGTGGGLSPLGKRPSWQRARGLGGRGRQVPDVAAPADCDSGYFIVYPVREAGGWTARQGPDGCGTSAAAPFWAASTALVRQYARRNGVRRIDFLAPLLYRAARLRPPAFPFHDVQTGGNLRHDARPGWDPATGLGSPDVWKLARAIVRLER